MSEDKSELVNKFGQGYEILIGQDISKAKSLFDKLVKLNLNNSWQFKFPKSNIPIPNQDTDLRMFVSPGLFSPVENKFVPAFRLSVREGDFWKMICMPWDSKYELYRTAEQVYDGRFELYSILDYRTDETPERHCGDDDEGC